MIEILGMEDAPVKVSDKMKLLAARIIGNDCKARENCDGCVLHNDVECKIRDLPSHWEV